MQRHTQTQMYIYTNICIHDIHFSVCQHNSTGVNNHAAFHRHGSDHQGTKGSASPKHFTAGSLKDVLGEVYFLGGAGKRWIIYDYFILFQGN